MPTIVDQALVVRVWDWSETSQTVSLFCRESGMLRGVAKGARREKGRFSGGLDLLTRGEVVASVKPNAELATLTDWALQEIFQAGRRDLRRHYTSLYLLDILQRLLTEADPHPQLWDQTLQSLQSLEQSDTDPASALLAYQWTLLAATGHSPDLRDARAPDAPTLGFDPAVGGLIGDPGPGARENGPWRVRMETVALLRSLECSTPGMWPGADADAVDRASRLLATYIAWLLGRTPPTSRMLFGPGRGPEVRKV